MKPNALIATNSCCVAKQISRSTILPRNDHISNYRSKIFIADIWLDAFEVA
jgi:hypothetical protein